MPERESTTRAASTPARRPPGRRGATGAALVLVACTAALAYAALTALVVVRGRVPLDGSLLSLASTLEAQALRTPMYLVSDLGDLAIAGALVAGVVGIAFGPASRRRDATLVCAAVGGAMAVKWVTSSLVARPATGLSGSYDDFPSGHAAGTMAVAGTIAVLVWERRRRWVAVAALAFALAVGVSRVYLRKHFPSDVFAGWLLAVLMVSGVAAAQRLGTRRIPNPLAPRVRAGPAAPRAGSGGARPSAIAEQGCER